MPSAYDVTVKSALRPASKPRLESTFHILVFCKRRKEHESRRHEHKTHQHVLVLTEVFIFAPNLRTKRIPERRNSYRAIKNELQKEAKEHNTTNVLCDND